MINNENDLLQYISTEIPVFPEDVEEYPEHTDSFTEVLERTCAFVLSQKRDTVNGIDLFIELLREDESYGVYLIQSQGFNLGLIEFFIFLICRYLLF